MSGPRQQAPLREFLHGYVNAVMSLVLNNARRQSKEASRLCLVMSRCCLNWHQGAGPGTASLSHLDHFRLANSNDTDSTVLGHRACVGFITIASPGSSSTASAKNVNSNTSHGSPD